MRGTYNQTDAQYGCLSGQPGNPNTLCELVRELSKGFEQKNDKIKADLRASSCSFV